MAQNNRKAEAAKIVSIVAAMKRHMAEARKVAYYADLKDAFIANATEALLQAPDHASSDVFAVCGSRFSYTEEGITAMLQKLDGINNGYEQANNSAKALPGVTNEFLNIIADALGIQVSDDMIAPYKSILNKSNGDSTHIEETNDTNADSIQEITDKEDNNYPYDGCESCPHNGNPDVCPKCANFIDPELTTEIDTNNGVNEEMVNFINDLGTLVQNQVEYDDGNQQDEQSNDDSNIEQPIVIRHDANQMNMGALPPIAQQPVQPIPMHVPVPTPMPMPVPPQMPELTAEELSISDSEFVEGNEVTLKDNLIDLTELTDSVNAGGDINVNIHVGRNLIINNGNN